MNIYTKHGRIIERASQLVNVRGMVILTRVEMRKAPILVEPYCIKMDTYECCGRGGLVTITTPWLGLSFRCARCLLQNFHSYFLLELSLLSSAETICQLLSYLSQIRPSEGPNSCIPLARIVEFNPKYRVTAMNFIVGTTGYGMP